MTTQEIRESVHEIIEKLTKIIIDENTSSSDSESPQLETQEAHAS